MKKITNRIGKEKINNYGSRMKIIEYNHTDDIMVLFTESGYIKSTRFSQFEKGCLYSPYCKKAYRVGYHGEGEYKCFTKDNKKTLEFYVWNDMIKRCYSENYLSKHETYRGCLVCDEWHNFQNFAEWFNKNFYKINDEVMNLEKDILLKGNKIYSPETCIFVPQRINKLFVKANKSRGDLPIGVSWHNLKNKYTSYCNNPFTKKLIHLGDFDSVSQAFETYKNYKEKVIKDMAEYYKGVIPYKLYKAMYNWNVNIND